MLTKKGKYGLKALVDLARLDPGETAFITEIASRNNIPKKFLDTILLEELVIVDNGPPVPRIWRGALSRPASEIRIGQVVRTLDGPLAPILCASRTAYEVCDDCNDPDTCEVRRSMTTVRDAVADILDTMTLEDFVSNPGQPILPEDELIAKRAS